MAQPNSPASLLEHARTRLPEASQAKVGSGVAVMTRTIFLTSVQRNLHFLAASCRLGAHQARTFQIL